MWSVEFSHQDGIECYPHASLWQWRTDNTENTQSTTARVSSEQAWHTHSFSKVELSTPAVEQASLFLQLGLKCVWFTGYLLRMTVLYKDVWHFIRLDLASAPDECRGSAPSSGPTMHLGSIRPQSNANTDGYPESMCFRLTWSNNR